MKASVFHRYAGPSISSAANVVTSFIVEAGFMDLRALIERMGDGAPISCTQAATLDCGMPAFRSASAAGFGKSAAATLKLQRVAAIISTRPNRVLTALGDPVSRGGCIATHCNTSRFQIYWEPA